MYEKETLDNGLRIVAHRMPARQSVSVGIWINAGGRYETTENKGISHLLEHILFKGTKKYSCCKIKETIEGVRRNNAFKISKRKRYKAPAVTDCRYA